MKSIGESGIGHRRQAARRLLKQFLLANSIDGKVGKHNVEKAR